MKRSYTIRLLEEHAQANIYSIAIDNAPETEFESFLDANYKAPYTSDIQKLLGHITRIGLHGALERYLRREGKLKDRLWALPDQFLANSDFRVFCLRFNDQCILLGNGGLKTTKTYQEDPWLNNIAEELQKLDARIIQSEKEKSTIIKGKLITGTKTFTL